MDLLNGIPSLDMTQAPRLCLECLSSIPDGYLGCPRCAERAEPPPTPAILGKKQMNLFGDAG